MMIGESEAFHAIQALIDKMAAFDAPVLIEGETGTGKELAARAIHYGGARRGAAGRLYRSTAAQFPIR